MTRLEVEDVDELRRMAASADSRLPANIAPPSLSAAVELACAGWIWTAGSAGGAPHFRSWAAAHPLLDAAFRALITSKDTPADFSAHETEVQRVVGADSNIRMSHRFSKSLIEIGGFARATATGLAGALTEMADNVLQHSGRDSSANGIQAYEVWSGGFEFAVGDVGRGVLASLRDNPRWSHLTTEAGALDAVVTHRASRRMSGDPGTGFGTAIVALADLGALQIRSGSSTVRVQTEAGGNRRIGTKGTRFPLVGVTVAVAGRRRA